MTVANKPSVVATAPKKKTNNSSVPVGLDKPLDIADIKTEYATRLRSSQQSLKKKLNNAKKALSKHTAAGIDDIIAEIDLALKSNKQVDASAQRITMTGRQLMAQISDLSQGLEGDEDEIMAFTAMRSELEAQLPVVLDKEAYAWYMSELLRLKADLESLREEASGVEQEQRKLNLDSHLRERIATMKGYEDVSSLRGDVLKTVELGSNVSKEFGCRGN
jgi:chromosome segregation ATPase